MTIDKVTELFSIYCPGCGYGFTHKKSSTGKTVGFLGGAALGAKVGAGIGIVGGPIGAIAGTVPGAIFGALFGNRMGRSIGDDPKCPKCNTKFALPRK